MVKEFDLSHERTTLDAFNIDSFNKMIHIVDRLGHYGNISLVIYLVNG